VSRWNGWFAAGLALATGMAPTASRGAASLLVDVEPREPWVGEAVLLRVRLVLQRDLAEEPAYAPPATTGFWAETPSRPESYYATLAGRRVLVTETRTRLYPLAPGTASVDAATAHVVFSTEPGAAEDGPSREESLRSAPVLVRVRPLPPGAPAGFDGAVGRFTLAWSADRTRTSLDVPVTVRLDVRGWGNLVLLKAPALATPGAEVLTGVREDSLPSAGSSGAGRVRFHWNVLAHRAGALAIAAPGFAWFDPAAGAYRGSALPTLVVDVGPPLFSAGPDRGAFPEAFAKDAPDPFARGPRAWAWALAGLLLGAALASWRVRPASDPLAEERTRLAAWRNAVRGPGGPAFWRAAEEVVEWLDRRGGAPADVRGQVAATRYGGAGADVEAVRARLQAALAAAWPTPRHVAPTRPAAVALAALGVLVAVLLGASFRPGAGAVRLQTADASARAGDVAGAAAAWLAMWQEGAHAPALAARLAWVDLTAGRLAPATVWVLRGRRTGARDRALHWVGDLVRDGGGLAGARPARLPVRRGEWAALALLLGVAAGAAWPRRGAVAALAALAAAAVCAGPAQDAWAGRMTQAVVARTTELAGSGLQLETGQVVEMLDRQGGSVRVRLGRDLDGRMPASALLPVAERR
jgi:hypothetical protein